MKKTILAIVSVIATVSVMAQGTINPSSTPSAIGSEQRITLQDGTPLEGDAYQVQIWVGTDAASIAPVGETYSFLSGGGAGFFRGTDALVVPNIPGGTEVTVVVQAFDAATPFIEGLSAPFTVKLGNEVIAGAPPTLPANLVGLTAFSLIPEPTTMVLSLLGASVLLLRRRR
jgi:hypothetical protein